VEVRYLASDFVFTDRSTWGQWRKQCMWHIEKEHWRWCWWSYNYSKTGE